MEEPIEDSNSLFSGSNMAPLAKRQTVSKREEKSDNNIDQKIDEIGFQIMSEVGIITALEVHPNKLSECITTFHYQRRLPSSTEPDFHRKDTRERADFIIALTSLFRKSTTATTNKFTILLSNGIVYFFSDKAEQPRLLVASQSNEFGAALQRQEIKGKEWRGLQFQRESFLLEGQQIRLFFGFILNWAIAKKSPIEVFANYHFQLALKETPLAIKHSELRKQYEYLALRQESFIGDRTSKLFFIKFQCNWYKEDVRKLEERIRQLEVELEGKYKNQKISHDFEFKINKFTAGLDQYTLDRLAKLSQ